MKKNTIRLLLIDNEEHHSLIRKHLNAVINVSYQLISVPNSQEGLAELLNTSEYDVCFVNFHLDHDKGLELIKSAVKKGCDLPIILLLNQTDSTIEATATSLGVMDCLKKEDLNSQLLERVVRYAMERKKNEQQLEIAKKTTATFSDERFPDGPCKS